MAKQQSKTWVDMKTPIIGAISREEKRVIAKVISNTSSSTVHPFVRKNITIKANLQTDEAHVYKELALDGYNHSIVNHGHGQYVKDKNYTNTIEGFWSQLKRSINGTYHNISDKHLQKYVDEFAFRYNTRKETPRSVFNIMSQLAEKQSL